MAKISNSGDRVAVKVDLPRSLDRAMEIQVAKWDVSKRQFIEDAVREKLERAKTQSADAA